jgi:hypothetical protein
MAEAYSPIGTDVVNGEGVADGDLADAVEMGDVRVDTIKPIEVSGRKLR